MNASNFVYVAEPLQLQIGWHYNLFMVKITYVYGKLFKIKVS